MFFFSFGAVFAAVVPPFVTSAASEIFATPGPRSEPLCAPLGDSTAPEPSSNALSAFTDDEKYDELALTAPIPAGYTATMKNANCAFSSNRYMLYVQLDSYDPEACAELCNNHEGCDSFNIYIQRSPSQIPGPACPNPNPIAVAQCALYSLPEDASSCTNFGQHIGPADANGEAFKTAMRSSNVYAAYNKIAVKEVTVTVTTTHHMHTTFTRLVSRSDISRRDIATTIDNGDRTINMTTTVTHTRSAKSKSVAAGTPAGVVTVTRSANPASHVGTVTVTRSANPTAYAGTTTVTRTRSQSAGATPSPFQSVIYTTVTSYYDKRAEPYTAPAEYVTVTVEGEPTYVDTTTTTIINTSGVVTVTTTIPNTLSAETTTITVDDAETPTYADKRSLGPAVTAEPMLTITIDENYVYTGPTDVPMKTYTIYPDH
ncbi:uncharacterized protein J4E88_000601 [Alternaria novae-zelandiae]|uniref:uncharacterized protein n=1 Tax=Alternaria novae-zelandiae TaxID=430562 RepID=UPI0020C4E548|nr:uncharacterized protein J4E88_000601 [Alternaria novae-zelandiae]KAI4696424.1 hypothetical protein J4E88_000601 [Alternaria novae-zelandiae]